VASADGAETTDGERTRPAYADDVAAAPASEAPAATDAGETAASADGEVITELTLVETDLGTIIADGGGRTLYLFLPDEQGPSTCTEGCIEVWPALSGPVGAGDGIDESLIGTATRPDTGVEQATYDGWPLYYFVQDVAAGDTAGQGLNDIWFVIDPSGEAIGAG
jgi:predicted lipoprotein with Yx(FWY)xxD motif